MSGPDFYGCYFPDHSPAYNHTSCNAGAQESWCCAKDAICLANGYCQQVVGVWSNRLARHSCTDKTWSSGACPSFCIDTRPSNSIGLYLAFDRPGGAFCCGVNVNTTTEKCQVATRNSIEPFDLPDGAVIWNRSSGATMKQGTLTLADLDLSSSNSSSAVSAASSNTTTSSAPTSSNIVPVAVGIAVPLAVLLIAALVACGLLFSQNRKLRKEKTEQSSQAAVAEIQYGQRTMSPAPVYEYKQPTNINWEPYTPQTQAAMHVAQMNQTPAQAPYRLPYERVEAGGTHVEELAADEVRKPGAFT